MVKTLAHAVALETGSSLQGRRSGEDDLSVGLGVRMVSVVEAGIGGSILSVLGPTFCSPRSSLLPA